MTVSDLQHFRLGVGQFPCEPGNMAENLERIATLARDARRSDADLLVTPELGLTGYTLGPAFAEHTLRLDRTSRTLRDIQSLSYEIGVAVGFAEETADARLYNSVGLWYRGELLGLHRKIYPPNYGGFDEGKWFGRGEEMAAFDTPWGRMAMLICADAWHPALPYLAAHDGADVLLYMAASAEHSVRPEIDTLAEWHALNRSHALTMSAYVAFANHCGREAGVRFTGGSQIVDPLGCTIDQVAREPGGCVAPVSPAVVRSQRLAMPFRRDDDLRLTGRLAAAVADRRQTRSRAVDTVRQANSTLQSESILENDVPASGDVIARIGPEAEVERDVKRI
jgi:predicted amidohydrolase